jgi:hypothetical protein
MTKVEKEGNVGARAMVMKSGLWWRVLRGMDGMGGMVFRRKTWQC